MKSASAIAALLCLAGAIAPGAETPDGWTLVPDTWTYTFPRDHGPHPAFKTEWWYFTGNLRAADSREFGYELTWFREGVIPHPPADGSRFIVSDFKFAHFALSDIAGGHFDSVQRIARGAYGEAGFGDGTTGPLAWNGDWRLTILPGGDWRIQGDNGGRAIDLTLTPLKPPVIEGKSGVSRKSAGEGHASGYYSYTRMRGRGTLTLPGGAPIAVSGETWFDHEWASNQLAAGQAGWDWFSMQLSDNTELMLYRMRLTNGQADPASSGTLTRPDGTVVYLGAGDFKLTPLDFWKSAATQGNYPIHWQVEIPTLGLTLEISTPLQNQELSFPGLIYWEGLIHATGRSAAAPVTGHGYLELTGYSPLLKPMSR
jgi:predicted secreted hydrolase